MHSIENDFIKIWVKPKGAELKSIFGKKTGVEYMWNADPAFWGKTSPVLFPIVGALKSNQYTYAGKTYELSRHGFARDMLFELINREENSLHFLLKENEDTLLVYPFKFELHLYYTIEENKVRLSYEVKNTNTDEMLFSIGAHPAFCVPIEKGLGYSDYTLRFEQEEKLEKYLLNKEGLLTSATRIISTPSSQLPLDKELFKEDALVFKNLKSEEIRIEHKNKEGNGLKFRFANFPYFGIWAAENADFVCLEPWCGIADGEEHSGDLENKEGIHTLGAGERFLRFWEVEIY